MAKQLKKKYDMVPIGDCTIDAFIQVEEATVHCNIHHEHCQICFSFADKIPYESLTLLSAGNCNNIAVGMARLGLKAGFYGTVGADPNGKIILNKLKSEKVSTDLMSIQTKHSTNFHFVLWYHGERTILIKHQNYDYKLPKGIENTRWIYLSSIGPKGTQLHPDIVKLLEKHKDIKMAFNPGTFQLRLGVQKLTPLLKKTEILFLNKEEGEMLVGEKNDIQRIAEALRKLGPKIVVVTDGMNGSFCLADGKFWKIGLYPHVPFEVTGCGDAFATGFTAAIMKGLNIDEAMRWGSRNAANVATEIGPQQGLVKADKMVKDLAAHKKFQPIKLN